MPNLKGTPTTDGIPFYTMRLLLDDNMVKFEATQYTLTAWFAELGGISSVAMAVVTVMFWFYGEVLLTSSVLESLFFVQKKEPIKTMGNKIASKINLMATTGLENQIRSRRTSNFARLSGATPVENSHSGRKFSNLAE